MTFLLGATKQEALAPTRGNLTATLMSLYKYMYIWCTNLELDYLPKARATVPTSDTFVPSHGLTHLIRSVSLRAEPTTNNPVDLCQEHENKRFKEQAKTLCREFTQKASDKISKASNITRTIAEQLNVSTK